MTLLTTEASILRKNLSGRADMVTNTISENKTITGNGIGAMLAWCFRIFRHLGAGGLKSVRRAEYRGAAGGYVTQLLMVFICVYGCQADVKKNLPSSEDVPADVALVTQSSNVSESVAQTNQQHDVIKYEERLRYDNALELRGEAALGCADRWLKGARALMSETGSSLDPESRKNFERRATYLIQGKYENLKRHEAREVRAGRIARLERELGELSHAKMYEVLSALDGLSGSIAQRAKVVRRIVGSICPAECDAAQKIEKAVADKAISQEEAEAHMLDFRRRVLDNVVKTLAVSDKRDQAAALLAALEMDELAIAREFGYSPYDLAVMRKALAEHSDKDGVAENSRRKKDRCDDNAEMVTGTGWFVNSNSVVTCYHVIDGASRVEVVFPSGERAAASVIAGDDVSDLAVLGVKSTGKDVKSLPIRTREAKLADKVWTVGYPLPSLLGQGLKYSEGVVNSTSGLAGESSRFQISTPVQPGNSGGALLDDEGRVVGIVAAGLNAIRAAISTGSIPQNVNYAVKSKVVASFLDANGVNYDDDESEVKREEQINRANGATVLVVAEKAHSRMTKPSNMAEASNNSER